MRSLIRTFRWRRVARVRTLAPALPLCLCVLALGLCTSAAQAEVAEVVAGTKVGLQPRNGTTLGTLGAEPGTFANENGNAVLHGTSEYAIYWDPEKAFHHEWLVKLDGFFHALGEAEVGTPFDVLSEYRDRSNQVKPFSAVFKGAYSDTAKFPAAGCTDPQPLLEGAVTCLTDAQLRAQLQAFIAAHSLPTGMGTVYFLLTPPGVTVCLDASATHCSDYHLSNKEATEEKRESTSYKDSFCSYHADINPDSAPEGDGNTILYAAIPWTAGTLGLAGYSPGARVYETAFDCQDGGWNPEGNEENLEEEPKLTTKEEEQLLEEPEKERKEQEEARRLEGPHQEEPNQEGKGEKGDYSPGLADLLINQAAEEEMNIVTDPLLSSWQDASGHEVTDLCRNVFGATTLPSRIGGSAVANLNTGAGTLSNLAMGGALYYINNVFSLAEHECEGGVGLIARFTPPNPVNAGETISLDGMESTVSLFKTDSFASSGPPSTTYATFSWNFGDGTPEVKGYAPGAPVCEAPWLSPCAASVLHAYQYGGTYTVTLTITDVAGNETSVRHQITVVGPPAPGTAGGSSSATSGAIAASSATGAGASSSAAPAAAARPVPAPVAAAAIASHSLKLALRKGLAVSYSVNEQVAGHFEVLLSRSLAHKLGIGGPAAVGLPTGTPPQVIIAKAVLVTTTAGHSTVRIDFSKATAKRLARLHKVTLMLRLIVRNAASHSPASTSVLGSYTLAG